MQGGMDHKGPCHVHDCLDGSLSMSILVLSPNSRERLTLSFLVTIATVFLGRENTVITMIMFDFGDTLIPQPLFETSLTHNRFVCTKRDLVFYPNQARCCIIINGATLKTAVLWFPSIPGRQTSGRLTDELVCRDKITNFVLVLCDSSLTILKRLSPWDFRWAFPCAC